MKLTTSMSKTIAILVLTVLVIWTQPFSYHVSAPPSINPVKPCGYIIYVDGSNYVANNCSTGFDDYRGANAYSAISTALSGLPSVGGLLHLKAGSYPLTSTLTVSKANVTFYGEGFGTVITQPNAQNLAQLVKLTAPFITLSSLRINGNSANQASGTSLVSIEAGGNDAMIQNLWITNAKGHALQIRPLVLRTRVLDNYFTGIGNLGVHFYNNFTTKVDSVVVGNYFAAFSGTG